MKMLTTTTIKHFTDNLHMKTIVFVACSALVTGSFLPAAQVSALPQTHKDAIDRNSPHYFLEIASNGSTSCSAETVGNNPENAAYVWNFFAEKELTPIAIAGIMGNFSEETGGTFDPAIKQNHTVRAIPDGGDGSTGYGIAQWTYQSRQAGLFTKMRAAGLGEYYGAGWGNPEINKTEMSRDEIEKLLDVELMYAWEQDSTKIKSLATALNATTSVGGNSGSTMIFHNRYEGSADDASQLQERITTAERILAEFGGGVGCNEQLGGVGDIEDAIPWAMRFIEDTKAKYPGASQAIATVLDTPSVEGNKTVLAEWPESTSFVCWGAYGCDECTTLSGWFVTAMTSYTYGGGNGGEVVGNLAAMGVPTGSQPKPFSIFSYSTSSVGHTGLVLNVQSDGTVLTLENNLSSNRLAVVKYNIKAEHPDATFAYVADKMDTQGVGADDE
jgi:surface antigen